MGRILLLLATAGALGACSHEASVNTAAAPPPPGISYRFEGDNIADANQRADQYCQQYGKRARLHTINHSGGDNIAVYDCT